MSFIEHIKHELNLPHNKRGHGCVSINARALEQLLHHFDRLDNAARMAHDPERGANPDHVTIISNGELGGNQTTVMVNGRPMPGVQKVTYEFDARTREITAVIRVIKPAIYAQVRRENIKFEEV